MNLRSLRDDKIAKDVPFREVVGCLMWIANQTRPDIANSVRAVARHSHEPKESHWKAAQKILEYLRTTSSRANIPCKTKSKCRSNGICRCGLRKGRYCTKISFGRGSVVW